MKKHTSIRIETDDLVAAEKLGIDLPEVVRQALKREIGKRSKRCPTCGQALAPKDGK